MTFELEYENIEPKQQYIALIEKVLNKCYEKECLDKERLTIEITLTDNETIKQINNKYRQINRETDVLSFPMYDRKDFPLNLQQKDILGSIIISIPKIEEQAKEYGHSIERELAYMLVHGFYHLMGYDHIEEKDKIDMREKEEEILQQLNIVREDF